MVKVQKDGGRADISHEFYLQSLSWYSECISKRSWRGKMGIGICQFLPWEVGLKPLGFKPLGLGMEKNPIWEWDLSSAKWNFKKRNGLGNGIGTPLNDPPYWKPCCIHVFWKCLEWYLSHLILTARMSIFFPKMKDNFS